MGKILNGCREIFPRHLLLDLQRAGGSSLPLMNYWDDVFGRRNSCTISATISPLISNAATASLSATIRLLAIRKAGTSRR
jgi:hypothetical protein